MDTSYARRYRQLYLEHWWWRARERFLLSELRRVGLSGPERILDVGCGDGLIFDCLRDFGHVEGVEPDVSLVDDHGPHRDRIHVRRFDESFRCAEPFTLVLFLDVLEHLEDPVGALRHAASLLAPTGRLIITVPAFNAAWTRHDAVNHHRTRYTRRTLTRVVELAGLQVLRDRYWFQWTFFVRVVQSRLERGLRYRVRDVRVPGRMVNDLLRRVCLLERFLLGPFNPPFGTSLYALCAHRRPQV
jgi:SAM-dependent methyltransferase